MPPSRTSARIVSGGEHASDLGGFGACEQQRHLVGVRRHHVHHGGLDHVTARRLDHVGDLTLLAGRRGVHIEIDRAVGQVGGALFGGNKALIRRHRADHDRGARHRVRCAVSDPRASGLGICPERGAAIGIGKQNVPDRDLGAGHADHPFRDRLSGLAKPDKCQPIRHDECLFRDLILWL